MDFERPDPRKWSSRVSETLIFTKSAFSFQVCFLMQNEAQTGANIDLKSDSESIKKVMHFLIETIIDF